MLETGIIGIGNAGSQVAVLANKRLGIDALVINSSDKDLETIPSGITSILIGDSNGSGKNRKEAQKFLKGSIASIVTNEDYANIFSKDVLFVASSTGGGTGSGASIIMANIVSEISKTTKVIIIGILPTLKEGLSTQLNSIQYLTELYKALDGATYMLYDNDKLSKMSSTVMMESINNQIVDDIDVIKGTYQTTTKYSSIDEKDMSNILTTKGRIVIASLRDIKEKDLDETTIEDLLIKQFKTNAHCELQRDKIVHRTGVITNLSDRLNDMIDTHIPKIQEFIGAPVEEYEHIVINTDRHLPNNVFLICSGLTQVNDRIRKINDRIEEINELQKQLEEDSELESVDFEAMSSKIERKDDGEASENVDLAGIFSKFNV